MGEASRTGYEAPPHRLDTPLPRVSFAGTIPRQHGAWSVLLLSYVLGSAVAGKVGVASLLLLGALLAAMPARHTLGLWLRASARRGPPRWRGGAHLGWAGLYGAIAAGSLAALVLVYHLWLVLPLGALAGAAGVALTLLERARRDRTLGGEILGMMGLSVATPTAYYVAGGASLTAGLGLWLLALLMFCGGVVHVRQVARQTSSSLPSRLYHCSALALALGLGLLGVVPTAAFLALAPATVRAALGPHMVRPEAGGPRGIRRLGFTELAHGVLFVVIAVLVFRLQP